MAPSPAAVVARFVVIARPEAALDADPLERVRVEVSERLGSSADAAR